MATTKIKHTEVTLQIKYQALQELEKGRTCKDVAAKFNLDAVGIIDVDATTDNSQPLTVEEIVNEFVEGCNDEPPAEVDDDEEEESTALVSCPSRNIWL